MKYSGIALLSMLLILGGATICAGDTLGVYTDTGGTSCNILDNSVGVRPVYVVHTSYEGATVSQFVAPRPACWTGAVWIGDSTPYCAGIGCGDSQTGITLVYGACRIGAIHVLTISYFVQGSSQSCCLYPLLPHPGSSGGQVEVADCDFNAGVAIGLVATVNADATCPCGYPVPVEETTWGRVKSLYGE